MACFQRESAKNNCLQGQQPRPLSLALLGSSPKGRALGSPRKLYLFAKASHLGRGGTAKAVTERARTLTFVRAAFGHVISVAHPQSYPARESLFVYENCTENAAKLC